MPAPFFRVTAAPPRNEDVLLESNPKGDIGGLVKYRIAMALAAFMAVGAVATAAAPQPSRAAQWAQLANLPDWNGIWEVDWANKRGIRAPRPQMKLTPE